jgi:hypothetical protein
MYAVFTAVLQVHMLSCEEHVRIVFFIMKVDINKNLVALKNINCHIRSKSKDRARKKLSLFALSN